LFIVFASATVETGVHMVATALHFESAESDLLDIRTWYQPKHILQQSGWSWTNLHCHQNRPIGSE